MQYRSLFGYLLAGSAILSWWYFAFIDFRNPSSSGPVLFSQNTTKQTFPCAVDFLTPLRRDDLKKALSGDLALMTKLITDWDVDAQILERQGFVGVKRLGRQEFVRAQMISRVLDQAEDRHIGNKYLAQTYVSASFLLALTGPKNIVAIPRGLREQTRLYPRSVTDLIPYNIDRYNAEEIYLEKPEAAFVANYSHPSTIQALQNQGIPIVTLQSIDTLPDITESIHQLGEIVNKPLQAELLTLFMESAMNAIDNNLYATTHTLNQGQDSPRMMYLSYLTQFSMPTSRTITGQLLERLSSLDFSWKFPVDSFQKGWMVPVDQEQIIEYNPDCLIIASSDAGALKNLLENTPSFSELSALQLNNIYFIDDTPQAPTQFLVLAYYDIAEALSNAFTTQHLYRP